MNKIWKIYFSPTGTTKKVCSGLAEALSSALHIPAEEYDFTLPVARTSFPEIHQDDITVFAVPTYAGRVPNVLLKYLNTIKGNSSKAIALVTFGNRNYDSSLTELTDILNDHGFNVTAAGAVSCRHSFSDTLGNGRPDMDDMADIDNFSGKIIDKLSHKEAVEKSLTVPGISHTYQGYYRPQDRNGNFIDIRKVTPKVSASCTDCGLCARHCPMGSISPENVREMIGICIKCNSCLKICPVSARYFDDEGYLYHKRELEIMYEQRAENSFFL